MYRIGKNNNLTVLFMLYLLQIKMDFLHRQLILFSSCNFYHISDCIECNLKDCTISIYGILKSVLLFDKIAYK